LTAERAFRDDAIDRHLLAGLDDQEVPDHHGFHRDVDLLTLAHDMRRLRTQGGEPANRFDVRPFARASSSRPSSTSAMIAVTASQ